MGENVRDILIENIQEYFRNALASEKRKEYNTAVTLYFKTLASLSDLFIFIKEKIVPSSHSERFRILEQRHPEIYAIIDKDFPFYQNSYHTKLNLEICEVIKKDVERLSEILSINL